MPPSKTPPPPSRPSSRAAASAFSSRWIPIAAAALTVVIRLPFLARGEAFFNADEAIQGLMARHIHEWPIFFWGQGYKGVPEAYLVALVFAAFGTGVMQLKAATLGIWAVAVALTTRLGQRWYGPAAGAMAGVIVAIGSPAVVHWSLCASAEVAWLTLIYAGVLLAYQQMLDAPERPPSAWLFLGCGLALWIHPNALIFVGALALHAACRSLWWRQHGWSGLLSLALGRHLTGIARAFVLVLHAGVVLVLISFLWTYAGARFDVGIARAAHPQKVFRLLTMLAGLVVVFHSLTGALVPARRSLRALVWFGVGLLPVAIFALRGGGLGASIPIRHLADAPRIFWMLVDDALPIFAGTRNMIAMSLVPWWYAAGFVAALVLHVVATARGWYRLAGGAGAPSRVFAGSIAAGIVIMLVPGGAYTDIHSYRYLMPFFGLAALAAASGLQWMWQRSRLVSAALAAACLAGFAAEQARWMQDLVPESSLHRMIDCLEQRGIRAATADYWVAYPLTFLSNERIIVDADAGARYPPYSALVRATLPRAVIRSLDEARPRDGSQVICTAGSLEAVLVDR